MTEREMMAVKMRTMTKAGEVGARLERRRIVGLFEEGQRRYPWPWQARKRREWVVNAVHSDLDFDFYLRDWVDGWIRGEQNGGN